MAREVMYLATTALALAMAAPLSLRADTRRWVGGFADTNWFQAESWEPAGVPGPSDSVIIETGRVFAATSLHISSLAFQGSSLTAMGDLVVTNFAWTAGQLLGTGNTVIPPGGTLLISGVGPKSSTDRTLVNRGELRWIDQGNIYWYGAEAAIVNEGTVDITDAGNLYPHGCAWYNKGLLRKHSSSSNGVTAFIGGPIYNSGTLHIESGRLAIEGTGTNTGSILIDEGAYFVLSGGGYYFTNHVLAAGTTVSGAGTLILTSHFLDCPGDISIPSMILDGGTLRGEGTATITNLLWRRGGMAGTGRTIIPPGGSIHVTSNGYADLGRPLENHGSALFEGRMTLDRSSFVNFGDLTTRNYFDIYFSGRSSLQPFQSSFNNFGRFTVLGRTVSFQYLNCTNFGIVEVPSGYLTVYEKLTQVGGSIRLQGGRLGGIFDILGGELIGAGPVYADIANAGSLAPGNPIGTMVNYGRQFQACSMTSTGTLQIEIAGTNLTQFDRIVISNSAGWFQLGGTLNIQLVNGFRPRVGDRFEILRFPNRYGMFETVEGLNTGGGVQLVPFYSRSNVVLVATNAPVPRNGLLLSRSGNGLYTLYFGGESNRTYIIEASDDLEEWVQVLTTNTSSGLLKLLVDPASPSYPRRFFRAFERE